MTAPRRTLAAGDYPAALRGRRVVLGVSGSVAAYKAADLASKLTQAGATVQVVLTAGGARFVTPLTFQAVTHQPVLTGLWQEDDPGVIAHVALADHADLLLVAPASADTLARLAGGRAEDFLSALYLVCRAPVLLAPAMNGKMWTHPAGECPDAKKTRPPFHRSRGRQAGLRLRGHRTALAGSGDREGGGPYAFHESRRGPREAAKLTA